MDAVERAQLQPLPRPGVVGEHRPGGSQSGRPPGKSSSMTHCRTVRRLPPPGRVRRAACAAARCRRGAGRHDPVDHRTREGDVGGHPLGQPGGHPAGSAARWSSMPRSRRPLAGRLSQLTRASGPASAAARAASPRSSSPGTVIGGRPRPGPRRAPRRGQRPVTGSSWYAFSVTVRVTTRIAGSASSATTAPGRLGACRTR